MSNGMGKTAPILVDSFDSLISTRDIAPPCLPGPGPFGQAKHLRQIVVFQHLLAFNGLTPDRPFETVNLLPRIHLQCFHSLKPGRINGPAKTISKGGVKNMIGGKSKGPAGVYKSSPVESRLGRMVIVGQVHIKVFHVAQNDRVTCIGNPVSKIQ